MELYLVGKLLKEFRLRRGFTQEDLSDVCAVATISRIENGSQVPSRRIVEALFQKIGYKSPDNDVPATDSELQRHILEKQMSKIVSQGNYEIKDFLNKYKNCAENMNVFETQAYLFYSAVYNAEHGFSHKSVLEQYNEALNLTFADYWEMKKNNEREFYLTQNELLIIANIAIEKYALGLQDEAILIMEDLKSYYEKNIVDEDEREKHFSVILLSLCNWYDDIRNLQKALEICELGILNSSKVLFPAFVANKGCILYKMGKKEEGFLIIKDAIKMFSYLKEEKRIKEAKQNLKTLFGIEIKDI